MIRIRPLTASYLILSCLLLLLAPPALAQTEGPLAVQEIRHQVRFAEAVQFFLTASSPTNITSAVLTYRTSDNEGMTIKRLDFAPAPAIELAYEIDLARYPLKPFVQVTYWWTVSDADNHRLVTDPQRFFYNDPRFEGFPPLTGQHVVVHWYEGDAAFGNMALDVAERAVVRIGEMIDPALDPPEPFHLYLYASEADLLPVLPATDREWVVGQAYPDLRIALAAIPPGAESASTMRWLIPHELTHLLLYEVMGSNYGRLPPWLNEGLAVFSEEIPDPDDALVLDRALRKDQLLALEALCHSFPYGDDQARLAYAQSTSVVRFIRENYGHSAIGKLVAVYSNGIPCQRGVNLALGTSLSNLESQWRKSLGAQSKSAVLLRRAMPWLLLLLVSLPLLVLVAQPLFARRPVRPQGQPREP
ncbi:MAG: hypothetical protein JSV36_20860 [Anaerolineae bacterium]|nr:MAG: hypothetical protein JSV36_20860 [Anaerolineae bacterium]